MVRSTMTGTVTSSGRGGTAAAMSQNEQTAKEHSTLEQQPPWRLDQPAWCKPPLNELKSAVKTSAKSRRTDYRRRPSDAESRSSAPRNFRTVTRTVTRENEKSPARLRTWLAATDGATYIHMPLYGPMWRRKGLYITFTPLYQSSFMLMKDSTAYNVSYTALESVA